MIFKEVFSSLKSALEKGTRIIAIDSQAGSCSALFLSGFFSSQDRPLIWICPDKQRTIERSKELEQFLPGRVYQFPSYEHLVFFPLIPSPENSASRTAALYNLCENQKVVLVTQASSVIERLIPRRELLRSAEIVMKDEETDRDELVGWLVDAGYEHVTRVERVGEFSVRGEILDVFPPDYPHPVRFLFFDNLVEEIRTFNAESQRTTSFLEEVILLPCRELIYTHKNLTSAIERVIERAKILDVSASQVNTIIQNLEAKRDSENSLSILPFIYEGLDDFFAYVPKNALFVIEDPLLCQKGLEEFYLRAIESHRDQLERNRFLAGLEQYYGTPEGAAEKLRHHVNILLNSGELLTRKDSKSQIFISRSEHKIQLPCMPSEKPIGKKVSFRRGAGLFSQFAQKLSRWTEEDNRVLIFCQAESSCKRLSGLLEHFDIPYQDLYAIANREGENPHDLLDSLSPGIYIITGFIANGFSAPGLVVLPDHGLFSFKPEPSRKKIKRITPVSISDIREGDLVVHRDHGIGIYKGLVIMSANGIPGEFISLEYRGGDRLYLPVDRLGLLQRYVGIEGREPRLDKLGVKSWSARKSKVRQAIRQIAHELVELYAARKVTKGVALSPPDEMYQQFEAAFPFQETQDQMDAIRDIMSDLTAEYPMDRLLCGDVGFGKTEVAMRAAFKAVQDGYQVAVLVPTTLLAEQHERTFKRRFQRFPVTIESISRFKSRKHQREAVEGAGKGSIDILIGTHRILQKDVSFKRLGLVIIDEEHRFGVRHKERLKLMSRKVNCLTLTATPIPRTLQLSLLGIRDLSLLETAPEGRLSIKTFLAEYDDAIVRDAIQRELDRHGQVFFVHNRVKGIHRIAEHVQRLVPHAVVDVAHGQMEPAELEDIMIRFVRGEINCLVCTTIIESGLDIPSANTMIINRADRLGIADLYQLRGRIGRSSQQAYAYLLVPGLEHLGKDAASRLRAVMETSRLGSGMSLAMHDLKIRGAGNILGVAQAGQIADVGYDLYLDLLKEAVDELQGNVVAERLEPEINLPVPAFIPEDYVWDVHERLELYRRLGTIEDESDEAAHALDMEDRFGVMPKEVINLLKIMRIKELCRRLNCARLDGIFSGKSMLILTFKSSRPSNADAILREIKHNGRFSLISGQRLAISLTGEFPDHQTILERVLETLNGLLKLDKD